MTGEEIKKLSEDNREELNNMNIGAGSMIKALLFELERNDRATHIKLFDAERNGHIVNYEFLEGDKSLVERIANALGFKVASEARLEVHDV